MTSERREFLKQLVLAGGALALGGAAACAKRDSRSESGAAYAADVSSLAWITCPDPYKATLAAVENVGGIERFVSQGNRVAILPNIGWARTPEQAGCRSSRRRGP